MVQLFVDETTLFRQFFAIGGSELTIYLERLSKILSYRLRPLIQSTVQIESLSEIIKSLHVIAKSESDVYGKMAIESVMIESEQRLLYVAELMISQQVKSFKPNESELLVLARGGDCSLILTKCRILNR